MSNGVTTWGEYLARKQAEEAEAKQVTSNDDEVEDKAVKKAATKSRRKKTEG